MAFSSGTSTFGSTLGGVKPAGSLFGNTQPAQGSGGIFGQSTQQQQPTGGIFGQQPQQQQQQPGGFFGQTGQQQPGTGTGLFGQTNTQQQQPVGGLFGQNTQNQTQQPSGGLFGTHTQPAGGLFGQNTQQSQPTAGGLFGTNTQQQQQPAGGIFGQSTAQPTGGIFGQSTIQTQPTGNLFGSTTAQPQQQNNLFGSTLGQQPTQQGTGLFGNTTQTQPSIFGTTQPQQQSSLGLSTLGQSTPTTLLTKGTKFNDLPDEIKRAFESIDSRIQGRVQVSKELHQRKLGEESSKGQELIRGLHKEYVDTSTQTHNDLAFMRDLKAKAEQTVEDTIVATRIVEGFRSPQGAGGGYLKDHANFPLEFFNRVTENMKHRLAWYKSTIEQIERKLSSAGHNQTPQGIAATLQAQHATFIALANKTALVDAELQKLKIIYTQLWRAKTGSMRDPFNPLDSADNSDYGMSGLDVK